MSRGWDNWQDRGDPHFSEPRNHALVPGGSEYSRYLWVRSQVPHGAAVLDIGCNCGQLAENLARDRDVGYVGIDVIPDFIEYCQGNKWEFGMFVCADFGEMGALDLVALGEFDVVTALEVIEHPISIRRFRANAMFVLKPGGRLVVTVPHPDGFLAQEDHPCHVRQWTRWRLERVFGPAERVANIHRDECGRLLSFGAVFVKPQERDSGNCRYMLSEEESR